MKTRITTRPTRPITIAVHAPLRRVCRSPGSGLPSSCMPAGVGSSIDDGISNNARRVTVEGKARSKRKEIGAAPTAKPQSSDQAPGEEAVQVNDQYRGGEPAPNLKQEEQAQHQTGG